MGLKHVCFANYNKSAVRSRDGAADQQQIGLAVEPHDRLSADGRVPFSTMPWDPLAVGHTAREGAGTSAAECPMALLHAVGGTLTAELVSFDGAGETASLAGGRDVDA